jgi:putative transcriptional regulator
LSIGQAIAEGLEDAIAFTQGEKARGHVHRVRARDVDVVGTRERLGLSQAEFATAFGVSVSTVRNWEQGRRTPEGPALVLLTVIEKAPRTVLRAIWAGPTKRKAAA